MKAIIAALPREVAGLVGRAKPEEALRRQGIFLWQIPGAVVAAAGMGGARVTLALEAALRNGAVREVISVGLAGACGGDLRPGEAAEAGVVVDVLTGERYATHAGTGPVLATADAIASVREKARLHESYGAAMVDMEAATVARLARGRGLAFRAVKGISDGPEFELEGLARFAGPRGEFRTGAFALYTALRPWTWGKAIELGRGSQAALERLKERLR